VYALKDGETKGHDTDANNYVKAMQASGLPINKASALPVFDFMLIGMGKDGHIGSLYPGRKEVGITDRWVLTVDKKTPSSITLSLPVMNNAKETRVVLMGGDKAEAALTGITKALPATEFPVCGVKSEGTLWMLDVPCAELVKQKGIECVYE